MCIRDRLGAADVLRLVLILALCPALYRLGDEKEPRPGDMTCVFFLISTAVAWLVRWEQGGAGTFIYFQF